ncbi:unnamed protein product [Kluyveromyces dobzhanskii CBS 2104]|uniref:WGS project CCBQ000000000 data, contig 00012 n=1 Tax=Kluyveromyces dobzhanskii CBS 2104 TaxID=1427455 RepID=A0A0A8L0G9_9SACH|nr:unnamed protein product [Kluyveromyces dobzhanskii CBS 2104]
MIVTSVAGNMMLLMYTLIYLRFMKDQTITLALFSLILIMFSYISHSFLLVYHADLTENHEEMRTLMLRNFRALQIFLLLETVGSLAYHAVIDIERDVCRWKYGYWFTQFIGDLQCGKGGRGMLIFLDLAYTFLQLMAITYMSTNITLNTVDFKVSLSGLNVEDYGILSVLRMKTLDLDTNSLKITLDEFNVDLGDSYPNYSSTEVVDVD